MLCLGGVALRQHSYHCAVEADAASLHRVPVGKPRGEELDDDPRQAVEDVNYYCRR
jgi:hypothetical protein